MRFQLFLSLMLFFGWSMSAQTLTTSDKIKGIGIPLMESYTLKDYSSNTASYGSQNYDVVLGDDGRMYFANIEGLLIFEGKWVRVRLPGNAGVYSLAKASDGTIYVGAQNEIGYLSHNAIGELQYHSLLEQLGDQGKEAFIVYETLVNGNDVYFLTSSDELYVFDRLTRKINVISTPSSHLLARISKGVLYIYQQEGLYKLRQLEWEQIRDTGQGEVNTNSKIELIDLPNDQTILVSTKGIFDFKTNRKIPIPKDTEQWLNGSNIFSAQLISDEYLVISTSKGLLITDLDGAAIQFLDQSKGLNDDMVFSAAVDRSGLLWLGTNSGINAIEVSSPFTVFDQRSGLQGNVSYMLRDHEDLYLTTTSGTLRMKWDRLHKPLQNMSFETLDPNESRWLIKVDDDILSLGLDQTMVLENNRLKTIEGTVTNGNEKYVHGFAFENSKDVLLGSMTGKLLHLSKETGTWMVKKELDPSANGIVFIAQGEGGDIWLSGRNELWRVVYDVQNAEIITQKNYGVEDGLPYAVDNYAFRIGDKATFSTYGGIHRYDEQSDRIIKDERFESTVGDMPLLRLAEDENGNVYCISDGYLFLKKTHDWFSMIRLLNEKMINYNPFHAVVIDSANVLHPTFNAFVHVDPTVTQSYDGFNARIGSIRSIGRKDSLYYGGFGEISSDYQFEYEGNAIRLDFRSDYYQNLDQLVYKWRLIGMDDEWSAWSAEASKDFTNLTHGDYAFEVVAKNILFIESNPAVVRFSVATPWFYSYWAYLGYTLVFIGFVWGVVILNTRRLRAINQNLEIRIVERTAEINDQRNKLLQMDDLKRRFFVNISHEFRTPLTLNMGTVDQALRGTYGELNEELYANLKVAKRNSDRLLKMVTSILDISKLEGGRIQLQASLTDPTQIIRKVLSFFSSRFVDKGIHLEEELQEVSNCYLDEDKFETILINIISNSLKFTPSGGTIKVSLSEMNGEIIVEARDSGEGIPVGDTSLVFDRFYQSPTIKSGEGIGVGLALSKELVDLHKGTMSAENDNGAVFTIRFKTGKDHLEPNQIVEPIEERSVRTLEDKYPIYEPLIDEPVIQNNEHVLAEHILLVEDNKEMSQFISGILGKYYRVSAVPDGAEGLTFLEHTSPDLIVTDYLMPKMDGYEMAVEIKKNEAWSQLPIIFLTARATEQDKINVLNLGVNDYLFKPFSPEELLVRIKNLLYTHKQRLDFIQEEAIDLEAIEWKEFPSKLKEKTDEYITTHIKGEITAEQLAEYTNQSERSLYRKIKANTGLSVMGYVKESRLRRARAMLENQELPTVSEVSYAVGFNYLSHFTKSYKERFGRQPSDYLG
ncbi:MAG: response regulator [Cyclobacteriaceae bacterium]